MRQVYVGLGLVLPANVAAIAVCALAVSVASGVRAVVPRGAVSRTGAGAIAVMVTALLVCGCSGHGAAQTATVPSASPAQASASRTYLNGKGHGLIGLDDLAGKVAGRRTAGACRADEKTLVRLTEGSSGPGVADPGLAELFGDEFAALSSVLEQCTRGDVPASELGALSRVHTLIDERLRADRVHP